MRDKGITLIALVVTIIVLLILAGVSIATLTGDNGILTQATKAKEETEIATDEEQRKLAIAEATMNFEETEYQGIKIPAGMAPTRIEGESTVKEGLVAIDKNGNEWVWIEVPKSAMSEVDVNFEDETGYSDEDEDRCEALANELKAYASNYTSKEVVNGARCTYEDSWYEGCVLNYEEYKEMYQKMLKSIYNNKGFWIGRYEAGIEGSTGTDEASLSKARLSYTAITSDSLKAICQKDAIPYNYVTCSEAQKLASEMTPDETKTSSLLFGIQWYLVCKYLDGKDGLNTEDINNDSSSWGNYKNQTVEINSKNAKQFKDNKWNTITGKIETSDEGILLSTGPSNYTKRLNIYDFAGNDLEWTLEKANSSQADGWGPCTCMGGAYNNGSTEFPASCHCYGSYTTTKPPTVTFRSALY